MEEVGSAISRAEGEGRGEAGMSAEDGEVLQYLDSIDSHLALADSLSSTLRQGWLELASARHSMGVSRISPKSFDLKEHLAASIVQVNESMDTLTNENCKASPHFALLKWGFSEAKKFGSVEVECTAGLHGQLKNLSLRHRGSPGHQETSNLEIEFSTAVDEQIHKERSKSLSVFGTLVSPKLRSAQCSFERALEILIEMANTKSLMLTAFDQLQQRRSQFDKVSPTVSATSDSI